MLIDLAAGIIIVKTVMADGFVIGVVKINQDDIHREISFL